MREANGQFSEGTKHLVTHGMARTRIYGVWRSMRSRCENPNDRAFADYGGRGVTVCDRWKEFANFYADMGDRPQGHSLDRIDNDKGYAPENCRWATASEQARNQRRRRVIEVDGVSRTLAEWSEITGVKLGTLWERLRKGWTPERAITTPAFGAKHGVVWSDPETRAQQRKAA